MNVRAILLVFAALGCWARTSCADGAESTPDPATKSSVLEHVGISPQFGAHVPLDARFVDSDGAPIRLGDCLGKEPVILHLVYFQCPMLCHLARDGLLSALSTLSLRLGRDYRVVTVSFDPRDTPPLAADARTMALEKLGRLDQKDAWRVLTGDEPVIREVCDAVGFHYTFDPATQQYAHASGVFVLTPQGKLSRFLGGVDFSPRDLRLALVDAGAGKIGTTTDQFLLMCFHYDPTTGKYGLAIITALRSAATATVVLLVGYVTLMVRRERRGQGSPSGTARVSTNVDS